MTFSENNYEPVKTYSIGYVSHQRYCLLLAKPNFKEYHLTSQETFNYALTFFFKYCSVHKTEFEVICYNKFLQ